MWIGSGIALALLGRLPFEDDRGVTREGKEALSDLVEQWRYGGSEIATTSARREESAGPTSCSMP